jgi:hypothetical protein
MVFLAWIFNLDVSTICRIINNTLKILYSALCHLVAVPSIGDRLFNGVKIGNYFVTMALDGTEQQIYQSVDPHKKNINFSGKKQMHTFTTLIGVSLDGRIRFVSFSYSGILAIHCFS